MVYHILVASYSNDITTLLFDPSSATLQVSSAITVGHHPSWLTSHLSHPSLVWTGLEQSNGKILTLRYDENGKGTLVSETSSAGKDPCHLFALKDELLVANVRSPIHTLQTHAYLCYLQVLIGDCRCLTYQLWHDIYSEIHPIEWQWPRQITTGGLSPPPSHCPRRIRRTLSPGSWRR